MHQSFLRQFKHLFMLKQQNLLSTLLDWVRGWYLFKKLIDKIYLAPVQCPYFTPNRKMFVCVYVPIYHLDFNLKYIFKIYFKIFIYVLFLPLWIHFYFILLESVLPILSPNASSK